MQHPRRRPDCRSVNSIFGLAKPAAGAGRGTELERAAGSDAADVGRAC